MLVLICSISVAVLVVGIILYNCDYDDLGMILMLIGIMLCIISVALCIGHIANLKEAELINAEFGTSYTAWDMFWNSETIKELLIGKSIRLN